MPAPSRRLLRVLGALLLAALSISAKDTALLEGCIDPPTAPPPMQLPRSPEELIGAVKWSYENRSINSYRKLLTDDFRLTCTDTDSAGSPDGVWTREDELRFFTDQVAADRTPPAPELSLDFGPLTFTADPRPGFTDSRIYQRVSTDFTLRFARGLDPVRTLTGRLQFFVVRGDTAVIPEDLTGGGARPDSRVWYIQRWEDVTTTGDGWCAFPGRNPLPRP